MSALITKLTESVNNPLLKKIDEAVYPISSVVSSGIVSYYNRYVSSSARGGKARLVGGGYFVDAEETNIGTEISLDPGNWTILRLRNAAGNLLFITGKERLVRCTCQPDRPLISGLDIDQFKYCDSITTFLINDLNATGNLASLMQSRSIQELKVTGSKIKGDFGIFSDYTSLQTLSLDNVELTGDVTSLKKNVAMTWLSLSKPGRQNYDFDGLADGMVDEGRISGSLKTWNSDGTIATYTFSSDGWTKA